MTRSIPIVLLSLLSAGVLTFCAPQPAAAQPAATASGAICTDVHRVRRLGCAGKLSQSSGLE